MTMTLIQTTTLGTAAATIELTSIPQTFTDLVILASVRANTGTQEYLVGSFNSTTTGYNARELVGTGTGAISNTFTTGASARVLGLAPGNGLTANTFSNTAIYLPNYSGSATKSWLGDGVTENNATSSFQGLIAGLWSNAAAITSISISPFTATTWLADSTISLYGITKGTDGIVTTSP
jgi:hypothetical protein